MLIIVFVCGINGRCYYITHLFIQGKILHVYLARAHCHHGNDPGDITIIRHGSFKGAYVRVVEVRTREIQD